MNALDYTKLAKEVHANSVKHGWWEDKPSTEHFFTLVVCELAEAVEADREGSRCDQKLFASTLCTFVEPYRQNSERYEKKWNSAFEQCVKDTVEDELADAVIRLLDIAGARNYRFSQPITGYSTLVSKENTFTENIGCIMECVATRYLSNYHRIACSLVQIEELAKMLDIDLAWHIEHKMRYNASRPYKHGKAY